MFFFLFFFSLSGMYKFACLICQKRFPTQAKLNFHTKSHENPQWRCDVCSKMFTTKQYLRAHEKSHNKPITVQFLSLFVFSKTSFFACISLLMLVDFRLQKSVSLASNVICCSKKIQTFYCTLEMLIPISLSHVATVAVLAVILHTRNCRIIFIKSTR